MQIALDDNGITSPRLLDASTKRGIETREAMKRVIARFRARKIEHTAMKATASGLTQADIDGREADWAEKSESVNAQVARLP